MKAACITEQVLTLVNKRIGLYRHFDETVNRYKQSRDVSTLNSGRKSLETEHKALTSEIALLQSKLKAEGSDLCDKVSVCCHRVTRLIAPCHVLGIVPDGLEPHLATLPGLHTRQLCSWLAHGVTSHPTRDLSCGAHPCDGTRNFGVLVVNWVWRKLCWPVHMASIVSSCFLSRRPDCTGL